jgi:dienelactone hydrolase
MRITYWRPGWGDRHPAVMVVPGATPRGNDEPELRRFGGSLARAGYLVMLPEFAFLKAGRFDPAATVQIDAAFAGLRARPENAGARAGAFGVSVGGGLLLVTAAREAALREADFISVLGAYYDIDTWLASVVSHAQPQGGAIVPWQPSAEALDRVPAAAVDLAPPADRDAVRAVLVPAPYAEALRRIRALPPAVRAAYDRFSPEIVWAEIRPPIFWIHDPDDQFEPLAEAEAAAAAPRAGRLVIVVPRLVQHAAPAGPGVKDEGPLFLLGEIWRLIAFAFEILRIAG